MIQWGWWQVCQCLSWKTYTCWKKQNLKSVKFLTSLSEPFNRNSVKISDCRAWSLFETVPCCQTFSHSEFFFCIRLRIFSLFCRMYHPLADILFFTWKFYGDVNESPRIFAHFMLSIFLHVPCLHRRQILIIEKHFVCVILFQKEADQDSWNLGFKLNPNVEILR